MPMSTQADLGTRSRDRERSWIITLDEPVEDGPGSVESEAYGKLVLDPNWCFVLHQGDVVFAAPAWRVVNVEPLGGRAA